MAQDKDSKNLNVPPLRFPGFTDEWKTHRLSYYAKKITKKNKGNTVSNVLCNSANLGIIPQSEYFDRDIANSENTDNYYIIEPGDFVYNPRKSVTAPYGPINLYNGSEFGIISPLYLCFKVDNISKEFLLHWFKGYSWHRYVYSHGDTGVRYDRVSIKDDIFLNMPISLPPICEQNRISKLLSLIDERIATQNKIIDNLQSLIKGLRDRLFKSFHSRCISLGEIAKLYQPKTIATSELDESGYLVYGANGVIGHYHSYNHEYPQICITCRGNTCGHVTLTEPFSWITGNAMVVNIDSNKDLDQSYLFHFLSWYNFTSIISGSGQPQIIRNPLAKIKVPYLEIKEQKKISRVLDSVTSKIDLEQDTLRNLQLQKNYLVNLMFI